MAQYPVNCRLFAILQKYDFSSKSQHSLISSILAASCLRYCKSTIFQANHNPLRHVNARNAVVCDTAKVRFFKQITTNRDIILKFYVLFAILQKYDFSSKSQRFPVRTNRTAGCLRYCKSTIFQANHNYVFQITLVVQLFAILQKYDFSSKSQQRFWLIFEHYVVCDTAKVRFFKQITTGKSRPVGRNSLFAILQKYDFSSKSQLQSGNCIGNICCLRYCKSTIFQANHNQIQGGRIHHVVVCDTAKVRFFKQITTDLSEWIVNYRCLRYCKSTIFQANHNKSRI